MHKDHAQTSFGAPMSRKRVLVWLRNLFRRKPRDEFRVLRCPDGTAYYWFGQPLHPLHVQQLMAMHRKPSDNPLENLLMGYKR
jgi:hypothetical protein